ncbi:MULTISPECIES: hypothetical protein [Staphylococcus]|uniref:hypothetical protein n=1 Tax=Staphylococcus TaxID=1279 RepID=UPI000B102652|nr:MULTISPECIES: hypothetical protein [Staphylococcus]
MDWWKLTPIIISVLAMFISAINFLYNYSRNKKNLDIELITTTYPIAVLSLE